jgi:hypothetical protein
MMVVIPPTRAEIEVEARTVVRRSIIILRRIIIRGRRRITLII